MRAQGITQAEIEEVCRLRYGDPGAAGWGPRLRLRFGHHTPDEYYEAVVAKLVDAQCEWLDVGCGRSIFPDNEVLAKILANRCKLLVGIDPDDTLNENPFVHERVKTTIDNFHHSSCFDLVTLRMVAEHVADPKSAVNSLSHLTKPGGKVVVYTVNQWSPVSVIARIAPFRLHHYMKRLLWRTDEKDTFPVTYKMNTRSRLSRLFEENGFREIGFSYLDDCRTLGRFRLLHLAELMLWKSFQVLGLKYPENCLLGVYERVAERSPRVAHEPSTQE